MISFNENYNAVLIRFVSWKKFGEEFSLIAFVSYVVLAHSSCVCFQHLLFQFTIYDFDSFWFMGSPVKYLSSTLFLNEKGADLSSSSSCLRFLAAIGNLSSHPPALAVAFELMLPRIWLSHVAHALSRSSYRLLFVRFIKSNEIFLHTTREEKNRGLQKWNRRKKAGNNNV